MTILVTIRLEDFADLGLHQKRQIASDPGHAAGDQRQFAAQTGDAITAAMPADGGVVERESGRHGDCHRIALPAERGPGAGSAAELQHGRVMQCQGE